MSGPEFEGVLDLHRIERERRCYPEYECSCGWTGSAGDNGGPDDGQHDTQAGADAHLSAALQAEVVRWLGDEGTRGVVARETARHRRGVTAKVNDNDRNGAAAALAALTADAGTPAEETP